MTQAHSLGFQMRSTQKKTEFPLIEGLMERSAKVTSVQKMRFHVRNSSGSSSGRYTVKDLV
jgi:hypothetical protein